MLLGSSEFVLSTLDGRVLRLSEATSRGSRLRLDGLRKGAYVAKDSQGNVKISLF
jgi:hypothetical protein